MSSIPTACAIIIGNEILSGQTLEKNIPEFGTRLDACGIRLLEVRIIPDVESTIIETVNVCRAKFDYVFTTGGIGPTHDDITAAAIAKAFDRPLTLHPEAEHLLLDYYGEEKINDARMKMAYTPTGATLISNAVSVAPGFNIENVYVLAGVPVIMQAMMDELMPKLKGGAPMQTLSFDVMQAEGDIACMITDIQSTFPNVEIGVYPRIFDGKLASHVVCRSHSNEALNACCAEAKQQLNGRS